jgi:hypothetical protein
MDEIILTEEMGEKYSVENNALVQVAKADVNDKIETETGDTKQADFYPQVKIKRWDNEVNFSARLVQEEAAPTVVTEDGKIKWQGDKVEAHFYDIPQNEEHPDGAYEFEVILKERPATNVVTMTIQTKGLDFFYQPELTEEEKAQGVNRPENVIGSYAVYYKDCPANIEGGKEYKCGKAFHIYRPYCVDAEGNREWADMNVDVENGLLTITIPQKYLDEAVYPVVVDPTFGYDTAGASSRTMTADTMRCSMFTFATAGIFTRIDVSTALVSGSTTNAQLAIYGRGPTTYNVACPKNRTTETFSVPDTTKAWQGAALSSNISLTAADYWLVFWIDYVASQVRAYFDAGSANQGDSKDVANSSFNWANPQDLNGFATTDKYSIYATYLPPTSIPGNLERRLKVGNGMSRNEAAA